MITGIEARGFIFGPPIALAIGAKFVPMRKPKKLPGTFTCFDSGIWIFHYFLFFSPLSRNIKHQYFTTQYVEADLWKICSNFPYLFWAIEHALYIRYFNILAGVHKIFEGISCNFLNKFSTYLRWGDFRGVLAGIWYR